MPASKATLRWIGSGQSDEDIVEWLCRPNAKKMINRYPNIKDLFSTLMKAKIAQLALEFD